MEGIGEVESHRIRAAHQATYTGFSAPFVRTETAAAQADEKPSCFLGSGQREEIWRPCMLNCSLMVGQPHQHQIQTLDRLFVDDDPLMRLRTCLNSGRKVLEYHIGYHMGYRMGYLDTNKKTNYKIRQ